MGTKKAQNPLRVIIFYILYLNTRQKYQIFAVASKWTVALGSRRDPDLTEAIRAGFYRLSPQSITRILPLCVAFLNHQMHPGEPRGAFIVEDRPDGVLRIEDMLTAYGFVCGSSNREDEAIHVKQGRGTSFGVLPSFLQTLDAIYANLHKQRLRDRDRPTKIERFHEMSPVDLNDLRRTLYGSVQKGRSYTGAQFITVGRRSYPLRFEDPRGLGARMRVAARAEGWKASLSPGGGRMSYIWLLERDDPQPVACPAPAALEQQFRPRRDSPPVGPGGPTSCRDSAKARVANTSVKLRRACRSLIENGHMPSHRKVASLMGCSTTTLGRAPHKRNLMRYMKLAEAKGLGKVTIRQLHDGCPSCRARDHEIEKLEKDVSRLVRKLRALMKLVKWHRGALRTALVRLATMESPDLPRRPRSVRQ